MSDVCPITDKEAAWAAFHAFRAWEHGGYGVVPNITRLAIFEAANWRCCYCGVHMFSGMKDAKEDLKLFVHQNRISSPNRHMALGYRKATIEHVIRRADGGTDLPSNLAAACAWCNHNRQSWSAEHWYGWVGYLKERGQHPHFSHER